MKKKIYLLLTACTLALHVGAQQVEETQRTFVTKMAATWCPPCGSWGWSFFDDLLADNADQAVFMAIHHSGLLVTDVGVDIFNNFGATYQPQFFLDDQKINVVSSNTSIRRTEAQQAIDLAFNTAPIANVGFEPVFANNKIDVNAKVKFFQETAGEFYLGIYLIEDGVIEFQQSIGNNAVHKKILRTGFTDDSFGLPITEGAVSAGSEFDLSFSLEISEVAGYDYEVAGIIWKKENNKYVPINIWSTKNINSNPTRTSDITELNHFMVFPTVTSDQAVINIDLKAPVQNGELNIFDLTGKRVSNVASGSLAKGQHSFQVDQRMINASGMYFIRFSSENGVSTQRIIFQ